MNEDEVLQEHITVDLTGCEYVMDFWERLRRAFGFDEHFGKNWDAFWDMLSWECPAHKVTFIGVNKLPQSWKNANGVPFPDLIHRTLQRNKELKARYHYEFDYEFIDA